MMNQTPPTPVKGSAWTAIAVLGFALVGVLKRPVGAVPGASGLAAAAQRPGTDAKSAETSRPGASDEPTQHPPGVMGVGRAVFDRFGRDNISLVAAGVAFYVMLSIFPALAAMVSLYALVGNPDDVANRIADYGNLLPPEALKLITDGLHNFAKTAGSTLSTALATSVLLALWSARAGISSIMTGLNIAYEETEKRSFVVQTLVALGLTIGGVVFAVLIVLALAVVPIVLKFLYLGSFAETLFNIARWPVLAILVTAGFAVFYRYGPSRRRAHWRWISWGSCIATAFVAGRISRVLDLCEQVRVLRRDLRRARSRHRPAALALGERTRAARRRGDRCRTRSACGRDRFTPGRRGCRRGSQALIAPSIARGTVSRT